MQGIPPNVKRLQLLQLLALHIVRLINYFKTCNKKKVLQDQNSRDLSVCWRDFFCILFAVVFIFVQSNKKFLRPLKTHFRLRSSNYFPFKCQFVRLNLMTFISLKITLRCTVLKQQNIVICFYTLTFSIITVNLENVTEMAKLFMKFQITTHSVLSCLSFHSSADANQRSLSCCFAKSPSK